MGAQEVEWIHARPSANEIPGGIGAMSCEVLRIPRSVIDWLSFNGRERPRRCFFVFCGGWL